MEQKCFFILFFKAFRETSVSLDYIASLVRKQTVPERKAAKTFSWKYVMVEFRSFLAHTKMQTFGGSELSS